MCIAIARPANAVLTKDVLKRCYRNNPDSWGFAYPDDKKKSVIVKRGLSGFREFWNQYREVPIDRPMLIHFRIATSGKVNEENCHPFLIDKKHALVHNGKIDKKFDDNMDELSDTAVFVSKILRPLFASRKFKKGEKFWASNAFKWLIERSIGYGNKMVILSADGFEVIYNKKDGEIENEIWFSNKTYKEDRLKIKGVEIKVIIKDGWKQEIVVNSCGRIVNTRYLEKVTPENIKAIEKETQTKSELSIEVQRQNKDIEAAMNFQQENGIDTLEII